MVSQNACGLCSDSLDRNGITCVPIRSCIQWCWAQFHSISSYMEEEFGASEKWLFQNLNECELTFDNTLREQGRGRGIAKPCTETESNASQIWYPRRPKIFQYIETYITRTTDSLSERSECSDSQWSTKSGENILFSYKSRMVYIYIVSRLFL